MAQEATSPSRAEAAAEFDREENRGDGARVAASLADGLRWLCDAFLTRVYSDVEKKFGVDSMLMPTSLVASEEKTHDQIEIYEIAESVTFVADRRYTKSDVGWYLKWLTRLLLDSAANDLAVTQRIGQYLSRTPDERRRAFSHIVERTLPETMRAPSIVYRLLPPAVSIVTAVAFDDHPRAVELRNEQVGLLPSIADCHDCHGRLLEIGESCALCGNPFWKFNWLTAE
jgi:hypothetical protein